MNVDERQRNLLVSKASRLIRDPEKFGFYPLGSSVDTTTQPGSCFSVILKRSTGETGLILL